MTSSSVTSLLVAALLKLQRSCPYDASVARLLLARAARHDDLSPAERDACRSLADALDTNSALDRP